MSQYRTVKTTMGRKIRVRMSEQEVLDRMIYWAAVTILPFVGSALLFWIWGFRFLESAMGISSWHIWPAGRFLPLKTPASMAGQC